MFSSVFFNSESTQSVIFDGFVGGKFYSLRNLNGVSQPKMLNTPMELGRNIRHNNNVSEILCVFDMSAVPSGKTITGIDFMYQISEYNNSVSWAQIELLLQNHQIPLIVNSVSPTYHTTRHPASYSWHTALQTDLRIIGPTSSQLGWFTITAQSTLLNAFREWYSTPSENAGLIMQLNCNQEDYIVISGIKIKVYYS